MKTQTLFFSLFLFFLLHSVSIIATTDANYNSLEPTFNDENKRLKYENLDIKPEFPGGINKMYEFLSANIKYSKEVIENNIQGRVICQFIVGRDGSINDVIVVRSVHEVLDKEAIRVIQLMPKWTPGVLDGEPVRVKYTLPIRFKL